MKSDFCARDPYAGGTELNDISKYFAVRKINITGPFEDLQRIQMAIHTVYELMRGGNCERVINSWKEVCPEGVEYGTKLFKDRTLQKLKEKDAPVSEVFDITSDIHNI